jgi:hypothetical protein
MAKKSSKHEASREIEYCYISRSVVGQVKVTNTNIGGIVIAVVKVTADFTLPTLVPASLNASLPNTPTCKLLKKQNAGDPWQDASGSQPMQLDTGYSYEYTFQATPGPIYGAYISGTWMVTGGVPDNSTVSS